MTDNKRIHQFKITLNGSVPSIWRRIQVRDHTFDRLHRHIQAAMGWENKHVYRFRTPESRFAVPGMLDDDQFDFDSTNTLISEVVPSDGSRRSFLYEYDFGDGWIHSVLFEGWPDYEDERTYPFCVEGERACPPEDVGGLGGYEMLLEALENPKRKSNKELIGWVGEFHPDDFDAQKATIRMRV